MSENKQTVERYMDGFNSNDIRLQFTFKYNFSVKVGG